MMTERELREIAEGMTIEQKAGQFLVYGFSGALPHRDVLESIEKYHVAGFRVTPHARVFTPYLEPDNPIYSRVCRPPEPTDRIYHASSGEPRLTMTEYAETLNMVRRRSLETGAGIPVHFEHDFEGNYNADTTDHETVVFPHYMGIAATGDPGLARDVGRAKGRQLKAIGVDLVHGPVLDVNTEPANPEIETRSFSALPDIAAEYGLAVMRGYDDGGVAAVAKHFPGRGASRDDAHYAIPVITESRERMDQVHLAPYRRLIAEGLPAIMLAHSVYPALDPTGEISTLSRPIVTGLLREELGFDGVVITDSFTMAGLVARYEVPEAGVRAIEAGVDLILMKDENALRRELFEHVVAAIRSGRLSEERVLKSTMRVLRMKNRYGMMDGSRGLTDPAHLRAVLDDPWQKTVSRAAARKAVTLLRAQPGALPVPKSTRLLVCEESFGLQGELNNSVAYCGALYHALLAHGYDALYKDFDSGCIDAAWPLIAQRAALADVIVLTGYTKRGRACPRGSYERFLSLGKPVIFVANSPYPKLVPPQMQTVLVTFATHTDAHRAVADIIAGTARATGSLGFDPARVY